MKLFVIYFISLLVLSANCISQTRITTTHNNYICFILNENKTYLTIQTFQNQKLTLKKSFIIKLEEILVYLESDAFNLTGNVKNIQDDELEMMTSDSTLVKIKINTIENCKSDDSEVEKLLNDLIVENQAKSNLKTIESNLKYRKFGATLGIPQYVMLNYGFSNNTTSTGISLGYMGMQLNYGLNILSTENMEMNLLVNLNILRYLTSSYMGYDKYKLGLLAGPLIDFYAGGFHAQGGFGFGLSKEVSTQAFLQVGYAYRWGK